MEKPEKKLSFHHTVEMKQTHPMTGPIELPLGYAVI